MSLDTVLRIGKALRDTKDNLKHFKYVAPCPKAKKEFIDSCFTIPLRNDLSIEWNEIKKVPENEKDALYYMRFKTSDSDSLVKYIFGDIYYSKSSKLTKTGKIEVEEGGYYRLGNPNSIPAFQKSSFDRGKNDFENMTTNYEGKILTFFRKSIESNLNVLEKILNNISAVEQFVFETHEMDFLTFLDNQNEIDNATIKRIYERTSTQTLKKLGIESELFELTSKERERLLEFDSGDIFIHFEFPEKKHWYEFTEEFDVITAQMFEDFVEKSAHGQVLKKTLYKTLCSGDKKNDWQFPSFEPESKYKAKAFSNEEIKDLFYAVDYASKGRSILGTDLKIIVLPKGECLDAEDFEKFHQSRYNEKGITDSNQNKEEDIDPLFDLFENENEEAITSFDVIFCKKGGTSSPDVDLLEISGIEKSKIQATIDRIYGDSGIAKEIQKRRKAFLRTEKDLFGLKLEYSLCNILGNPQTDLKKGKVTFKANPKYQSHILKVLPLIYTDSYYQDDMLLSSFLQNAEYSIRAGDNKFNLLKFDFEFLIKIQNSQINKFMEITNSNSYQIGLILGSLAKNLSLEINSFEKNYVGNLTRRISSIQDFIKLKNELEQKLIMHEKSKFTFKESYDLTQKVKTFEGRYDKEECAFGFFESYFKPIPKKIN